MWYNYLWQYYFFLLGLIIFTLLFYYRESNIPFFLQDQGIRLKLQHMYITFIFALDIWYSVKVKYYELTIYSNYILLYSVLILLHSYYYDYESIFFDYYLVLSCIFLTITYLGDNKYPLITLRIVSCYYYLCPLNFFLCITNLSPILCGYIIVWMINFYMTEDLNGAFWQRILKIIASPFYNTFLLVDKILPPSFNENSNYHNKSFMLMWDFIKGNNARLALLSIISIKYLETCKNNKSFTLMWDFIKGNNARLAVLTTIISSEYFQACKNNSHIMGKSKSYCQKGYQILNYESESFKKYINICLSTIYILSYPLTVEFTSSHGKIIYYFYTCTLIGILIAAVMSYKFFIFTWHIQNLLPIKNFFFNMGYANDFIAARQREQSISKLIGEHIPVTSLVDIIVQLEGEIPILRDCPLHPR